MNGLIPLSGVIHHISYALNLKQYHDFILVDAASFDL